MAVPLDVTGWRSFLVLDRVAGRQRVVQYRGTILPLVLVSGSAGTAPQPCGVPPCKRVDNFQVIVYSGEGKRVGLVVDRILDIVDDDLCREVRPAAQESWTRRWFRARLPSCWIWTG